MPHLVFTVYLLLAVICAHACPSTTSGARVAVVGAGMGGAFASYHLRELSGAVGVNIDVFEAESRVGGRAEAFDLNGQTLELGASIIWDKNLYMYNAARKLGVGIRRLSEEVSATVGFAVFDGQRFVFNQTESWMSLASLALRYGPSPLLYGQHTMKVWREHFLPIYEMQQGSGGRVFDDPEQMLLAMGLFNLTQQSCAAHLEEYLKQYWWSWGAHAFANDLAGAINRCNYNQNNSALNALAGLVSFLPAAGGELWAVQGGNSRLAGALLQAANTSLHMQHAVTHIARGKDGRYTLSTLSTAASGTSSGSTQQDRPQEAHGPYDAVIIATPLETTYITFEETGAGRPAAPSSSDDDGAGAASTTNQQGSAAAGSIDEMCRWFRCEGRNDEQQAQQQQQQQGATATSSKRTFQPTVTTYLTGDLQPTYFGVRRLPSKTVFVADNAQLPFSSISPKLVEGRVVYKVFSPAPLNGSLLVSMFGPEVQVLTTRAWSAYPHFHPPETFAPFRLGPGLCYINTIENAASAMEMSAIGARNCALMLSSQLQPQACRTPHSVYSVPEAGLGSVA